MRDGSQHQVSKEVGDESGQSEALSTQLLNLNALVTDDWMKDANCEHVSESRGPKLVIAIEKSSVGITDSPEPKRW